MKHLPLFRRLRNRILILNMVLTSLILLASFTAVYLVTSNNINTENRYRLQQLGSAASVVAIAEGDARIMLYGGEGNEAMVEVLDGQPYRSFALMIDNKGEISSINPGAVPSDVATGVAADESEDFYRQAAAYAWQHQQGGEFELAGRHWLYEVAPMRAYHDEFTVLRSGQTELLRDSESLGFLVDYYEAHFLDITDSRNTLHGLLLTFPLVGLFALAAIFFVSRFFANRSIRPMEQAWEQQRRFVADASHELKTPLAIITANSDALLANEQQTISSQREWLDYLRIGTDRMQRLIEELLTYARIEEAEDAPAENLVDLSAMAEKAAEAFLAAAAARHLSLTVDIEGGIVRLTDQALVEVVLFALIENAVKYADEGGFVKVSMHETSVTLSSAAALATKPPSRPEARPARRPRQGVTLTVANSGAGIASEDLPHLFERFYRADRARSAEGGNYGLGLSIVKAALDRLGGEIDIQSTPDDVTVFTVRL